MYQHKRYLLPAFIENNRKLVTNHIFQQTEIIATQKGADFITTQQLESFIKVAEGLSFARAAEALNITTSAISRQIQSLEEELDTKLLNRSTRAVSLTPAGVIFLNDAKEILARLQLAAHKIKSHSEITPQIISIGCVSNTDLSLMTNSLQYIHKQMPDIHPFLRILPPRMILNMLLSDELDFIFGFKDDIAVRDNLLYYELDRVPVCIIMPADNHLNTSKELTERELADEKFILCNSYEIPSSIASIQNRLTHQYSPALTYYSNNLQALLALIKSGYGISVLPKIPTPDDSLKFIPLKNTKPLSYGIFYKKAANNPVIKQFIKNIKAIDKH